MRNFNTTFVNLRAALDDLDPLVDASKPAAHELQPVLRRAARPRPPTRCRRSATSTRSSSRPGQDNDLVELTRSRSASPEGDRLRRPDCGAQPATPPTAPGRRLRPGRLRRVGLRARERTPTLAFFRAYTPSWSAGSTTSRTRARSTPTAASAGSAPPSTVLVSRRRRCPTIGSPACASRPSGPPDASSSIDNLDERCPAPTSAVPAATPRRARSPTTARSTATRPVPPGP